jgi:hypothetical protein
MSKIQAALRAETPAARIKSLEELVQKQGEMIERMRAAKVSLPVGKRRSDNGKSYLRVAMGDTHGAHVDKAAAKAFFQDLEILNPAEVVHGGDILDCSGFLAQHHTLGVVAECAVTWEQDVMGANDFLDKIEKYAPGSSKIVILGNHCQRVERTIIKWVLANQANAKYLLSMFGPEKVLNLEQRGIRCIRYDEFYDGLGVRGTVKLEKCIFRHGTRIGPYAAAHTLNDFGCNVVFFHTHRIAMATKETIDGLIAAWNPGCLCELRPLYGLTDISGWGQGYLIQCVSPGKGHLTIQIPIINGTSYLFPLLNALNLK